MNATLLPGAVQTLAPSAPGCAGGALAVSDTIPAVAFTLPCEPAPEAVEFSGDEMPADSRVPAGSIPGPASLGSLAALASFAFSALAAFEGVPGGC